MKQLMTLSRLRRTTLSRMQRRTPSLGSTSVTIRSTSIEMPCPATSRTTDLFTTRLFFSRGCTSSMSSQGQQQYFHRHPDGSETTQQWHSPWIRFHTDSWPSFPKYVSDRRSAGASSTRRRKVAQAERKPGVLMAKVLWAVELTAQSRKPTTENASLVVLRLSGLSGSVRRGSIRDTKPLLISSNSREEV